MINLLNARNKKGRKECFICGRRGAGMEDHHTVPDRRGGSDAPENVYTLCGACHDAVEKMYDDAFYERLGLAEERVEAFKRADGIEGREVDPEASLDRPLPPDSRHVIFDFTDDEMAIHCGYCNAVFENYEHALAAQHLRIVHRIEEPYERAPLDELAQTRWHTSVGDGLTVGLPEAAVQNPLEENEDELQAGLDRLEWD